MENYSKTVSEMYSQFKKETHPLEKYIGRLAEYDGTELGVVGYSHNGLAYEPLLIADASQTEGWSALGSFDVVFKKCESYRYVSINDLID